MESELLKRPDGGETPSGHVTDNIPDKQLDLIVNSESDYSIIPESGAESSK